MAGELRFEEPLRLVVVEGLVSLSVLLELNGPEEARAAHVANERIATQLLQSRIEEGLK